MVFAITIFFNLISLHIIMHKYQPQLVYYLDKSKYSKLN